MKALIFGVGGQDGFYLADYLLKQGYEVIGVIRRSSVNNAERISTLINDPRLKVFEGDITDYSSVYSLISNTNPVEVYNLAGQSSVGISFSQPIYTFNSISNGCLNILESIRTFNSHIKFYQASSGEMYGQGFSVRKDANGVIQKYQNEATIMLPQSPYAVAKLSAHKLVNMYRSTYNLFACSGILYNHESPLRGEQFVTRKITKWIGEFKNWLDITSSYNPSGRYYHNNDYIYSSALSGDGFPKLKLGNINVSRDWGHAKDYVRAMHSMMQYYIPDDYIISTEIEHSIKDFLYEAFNCINIINPMDYVTIDKSLYRPSDVEYLYGDSSKARFILKWQPEYTFKDLVQEMVSEDIKNAKKKERPSVKKRSII